MPRAPGWWQAYFQDHPQRNNKELTGDASGWVSDKVKTYCFQCLEQHVAEIQMEHDRAIAQGVNAMIPRERVAIESYLFGLKAVTLRERGWRRGAVSTLLNHLATCPYQPNDVKSMALENPSCTINNNRTRSGSSRNFLTATIPNMPLPPIAGPSTGMGIFNPGLGSFGSPFPSPLPPSPLVLSHTLDFVQDPGNSGRLTPSSLAPSDSISQTHLNPLSADSQSSGSGISRRPSRRGLGIVPPVTDYMAWTSDKQRSFENRLGRLTASAGLPFSWVDNPEWTAFVDEFIPAAVSPSRKTLSRRIIPKLVEELRDQVKREVYGQNATIQADGWTGENHHHLIAFMITVNGKLYTIKVHDASAERKTANNLLRVLEDVFNNVQNELGGIVVAIVTDASGESRKARRDFGLKYPWVIILDCYAHQVNLVVGDYFKVDSDVLKYTDSATDLITWLRGKTLLLALIREEQLKTSGITAAVIRAVLTRWATHLRAYERLLSLRNVLRSVAITDANRPESLIIIGDCAAKAKAKRMLELIDDGVFWQSLARVVRHLRPLGIAANVTQASFCRVDTVLLIFGHLIATYCKMDDPEDLPGCTAIIESIERRWSKADQEIFIAAVILNPFYQTSPFAQIPQFRTAKIIAMMTRLWKRFFRTDAPPNFALDLLDFLGKRGQYANLDIMLNVERNRADNNKTLPEPMNVFQAFMFPGKPDPPLIVFARRLLSVSANSASCERLFSVFGATLTKLRNRLGVSLLTFLTELKMHIRDEHIRDKTAKSRLKRRFEAPKGPSAAAAPLDTTPVITPITPNIHPSLPTAAVVDPIAPAPSGFRAIVQQEVTAVTIDDLDNEPLFSAQSGITTYPLLPISQLFDFSNDAWSTILTKHTQYNMEEELALYELLDLDAEGEDDVDVEFDETTEQVLVG